MAFDIEKELDYAHNISAFINQYRNIFNGINRYFIWDDSVELLVVDEITRCQLIDIMLSQGLVQNELHPEWFHFPSDAARRQAEAKWLLDAEFDIPDDVELRRQASFKLNIGTDVCLCKRNIYTQSHNSCTLDCTKIQAICLWASFGEFL